MDEQVRLVADVDWRRGIGSTAQAEKDVTSAVGRMDAATRKLDATAGGIGPTLQRTAQLGQRAMVAMSAGIGAATAATAAGEKQWLSLGAVILGSFAAGGPIAGAIALLGAGIGAITGGVGKASADAAKHAADAKKRIEELDKALRDMSVKEAAAQLNVNEGSLSRVVEMNREVAKSAQELATAQERLQRLKDADGSGFVDGLAANAHNIGVVLDEVQALEQHLEAARKVATAFGVALGREQLFGGLARFEEMQSLRDRNSVMAAGLGGGFNRSNETQIQQGIASMERALRAATLAGDRDEVGRLHEKIDLEQERLGIQRQLNDLTVSRVDRGLSREVELLEARNDQERELIRLRHRSQDLVEGGASLGAVAALDRASRAAMARRPWEDLLRSAEGTLGQGLSDVIYDGIVNGFENASDIAEGIWQTLLRSLINQFVQSGIQGLLGGLGGGGGGGLFGVFSSLFGGGGGGGASFLSGSGSGSSVIDVGGSTPGFLDAGELGGLGGVGGAFEIPGMAEGGIARRPSLRVIGERGPEAVVPLHKLGQVGGGGVSIGGITVNVNGSDLESAARLAAAKVYQAVKESGQFRGAIKDAARKGL